MKRKIEIILGIVSNKLKKRLLLLLVLMLTVSVLEIFSIGAIIPLLNSLIDPDNIINLIPSNFPLEDFILNANDDDLRIATTLMFCLVILFSGLVKFYQSKSEIKISNQIGHEVGSLAFKSILNKEYEELLKENTNKTISNISIKIGIIVSGTILPMLKILSASTFLILVVTIPLIIYPKQTILSIIFLGSFYFLLSYIAKQKLLRNSEIINKEYDNQVISINESLKNIKIVILLGIQNIYLQIFKTIDKNVRIAKTSNDVISITPKIIFETTITMCLGIIACLYSISGNNLETLYPILGALVFVLQKSLPEAQKIYSGISSIRGTEKQFFEVFKIIEKENTKYTDDNTKPIIFKNHLYLENIYFSYRGSKKEILTNFNLTINKNDVIGIVGKTGSGKSTFIEVLLGLLRPRSGKIIVDNTIISNQNIKSYNKIFGYVPQKFFLIDDTIIANISLGQDDKEIDIERIRLACEISQISKKIESLEKKYETIIGEDGSMFSGGEKQRLAIARAIYHSPQILILDEATSALDRKTERELIESMNRNLSEMTILMVAHRLESLQFCNRIIEINNGQLKVIK